MPPPPPVHDAPRAARSRLGRHLLTPSHAFSRLLTPSHTFSPAAVSVVTGVWYYENGESLPGGSNEAANAPLKTSTLRAPVCTALGLSFSKSFSTLCFASLILTICEILRSMARRSARNNGLLGLLIACCIMCIVNCIEFLTRFSITYHALTGDAFCDSARKFADHTTRYGLNVIVVDSISRMVLSFGAFVFSLLVGVLVAGIFYLGNDTAINAMSDDERWPLLLIVGLASWVLAFLPLFFVGGVLLNIIDAAYCCLVLDLEHQVALERHKELAYAVFTHVHASGKMKDSTLVINQPGAAGPVIAIATPVNDTQMGPTRGVAYPVAQPIVHTIPVAQPVAVPMGQPVGGGYVARP